MLSKNLSLAMPMTLLILSIIMSSTSAGNFYTDCDIIWGPAQIIQGGRQLNLKLDNTSGSAFGSKLSYLFGRVDAQIKLVPNNSAGTVTTFYLTSYGPFHDEIDFEFLGNSTGEPYTVHTNVFANGTGGREQQFRLWFDPTLKFHTYSIVWNIKRIIFLVDNIAIRVFNNNEAYGVPFPTSQPMKLISSLWNADDWATQGGRIKTNWTDAPFQACFRNININGHACLDATVCSSSVATNSVNLQAWETQGIDATARNRIRWVDSKFKIYDYCKDRIRFPRRAPVECRRPRFL